MKGDDQRWSSPFSYSIVKNTPFTCVLVGNIHRKDIQEIHTGNTYRKYTQCFWL